MRQLQLVELGDEDAGGTTHETAALLRHGFDPARLTQARHLAGLKKKEIAEELNVSAAAVGQWESGVSTPRPDHIVKLAETLDVPVEFLATGRPYVRVDVTAANFRSLRSTPAKDRVKATAFVEQVWEISTALERRVRLPAVNLPGFPHDENADFNPSAAAAAREVRVRWGLGVRPIAHLVRLMEHNGIIVTLVPFAGASTPKVDAFSTGKLSRPVVVLTPDRANDVYRHRFTAAHELGHLVMHRNCVPGDPLLEREADEFAAELLTPSEEIKPRLPGRMDLYELDRISRVWGVSVDSLVYRCREVQAVSDLAYRRAYQRLNQLRKVGLFNAETVDGYPGEIPILLRRAFEAAESDGLTLVGLGKELRIRLPRLRLLLGEGDPRPDLKLV